MTGEHTIYYQGARCTQLTRGLAERRGGKGQKQTCGHPTPPQQELQLRVSVLLWGRTILTAHASHYSQDANKPESQYQAVLSLCWGIKFLSIGMGEELCV